METILTNPITCRLQDAIGSFRDNAALASCSKEIRGLVSNSLFQRYQQKPAPENNFFSYSKEVIHLRNSTPALLAIEEDSLYPDESDPKRTSPESPAKKHEKALILSLTASLIYSRILPNNESVSEDIADRLVAFYNNNMGWMLMIRERMNWSNNPDEALNLLQAHFQMKDYYPLKASGLIDDIVSVCIRKQRPDLALPLAEGPFKTLISFPNRQILRKD